MPELVCLMSILPPAWLTALKGQAQIGLGVDFSLSLSLFFPLLFFPPKHSCRSFLRHVPCKDSGGIASTGALTTSRFLERGKRRQSGLSLTSTCVSQASINFVPVAFVQRRPDERRGIFRHACVERSLNLTPAFAPCGSDVVAALLYGERAVSGRGGVKDRLNATD